MGGVQENCALSESARMTVAQLIAELQKHPPDAVCVVVDAWGEFMEPVDRILVNENGEVEIL